MIWLQLGRIYTHANIRANYSREYSRSDFRLSIYTHENIRTNVRSRSRCLRMFAQTGMIRELVMIKDGLWRFSGDVFVPEDVHALIAFVFNSFFFLSSNCVLRVRFL